MKHKIILIFIFLFLALESILATTVGSYTRDGGDKGFRLEVISHDQVYQNGGTVYYRPTGSKLKITKWEDKYGTTWRILINKSPYFAGNDADGYTIIPLTNGATYTVTFEKKVLWWWESIYTIKRTFYEDITAPSATLSYFPNVSDKDTNGWYNQSIMLGAGIENPTVEAKDIDDSGSRLKSASWVANPDISISGTSATFIKEGTTSTTFDVIDNIGLSVSYRCDVKIDKSKPDMVSESIDQYIGTDPDQPDLLNFTLDWSPVNDNPFTSADREGTDFSGVSSYTLFLSQYSNYQDGTPYYINKQKPDDSINPDFINTRHCLSLEIFEKSADIQRDLIYYPYIFAEDYAKNISETTNLPAFSVPKKPEIVDIAYGEPYLLNEEIRYPVTLEVKFSDRSLDPNHGINGLKLYARHGEAETLIKDDFNIPEILDISNLPEGLHPIEGLYHYKYTFDLLGPEHAHKKYDFRLETEHVFSLENGNVFTESSLFTPKDDTPELNTLRVPNLEISDHIVFELYKGDSENLTPFTMVDGYGYEVELNNGEYIRTGINEFYTNESLYIRAVNTQSGSLSYLDPEGDNIGFSLEKGSGGVLLSNLNSHEQLDGESVYLDSEFIPPTLENETFKISVTDKYTDRLTGESISKSYKLPIDFSLEFDNSISGVFEPHITHKEKNPDDFIPDSDLGEDTPSNSLLNLALEVSGVSDSQSGIRSVTFYNVSRNLFGFSGSLIPNEEDYINIIASSNGLSSELKAVNGDSSTYFLDVDSDNIADDFSLEMIDGDPVVVVKVEDNAGNCLYKHVSIAYDPIPPSIPDLFRIYDYDNSRITLSASFDGHADFNESKEYRYSWSYSDIFSGADESAVVIDYSEMGIDELHNIPLTIADKAGNVTFISDSQFCTPALFDDTTYSPEELPYEYDIDNLYGTDDSAISKHLLSWRIMPSLNAATSYYVERIDNSIAQVPLLYDESTQTYTDLDLKAHGTYQYRVYPRNQLGDINVNYFKELSRTLKNNPPYPVDIISPDGGSWTTGNPKFTFYYNDESLEFDPDGDSVNYKVYIKPESGEFVELVGMVGSDEAIDNWVIDFNPELQSFTLNHGEKYSWKIVGTDTVDTTGFENPQKSEYASLTSNSISGDFTVDSNPPEILNILHADGDVIWHSSNILEFEITDEGSGVDSGEISVVNSFNDSVKDPVNSQITMIENGKYSVELPDGEFSSIITVKDIAGNITHLNRESICVDMEIPQIIGEIKLENSQTGRIVVAKNSLIAEFSATDSISRIKTLEYSFSSKTGDSVFSGIIDVEGSEDENNNFSVNLPFHGAINRTEYELSINVLDMAGNSSAIHTNSNLIVLRDLTPPDVHISLNDGFTASAGGLYVSDLFDIDASIEMDEVRDGIVSTKYALKNWETGEYSDWRTSLSSLFSSVTPIDGNRYSVAIEAINFLGLDTIDDSEVFIFDKSGPSGLAVRGISIEPYVSGETFRVEVDGTDVHSTITSFKLKIGNQSNPDYLTSQINGQREGALVRDTGEGKVFSFAIPELSESFIDGAYDVTLIAENGAGISSVFNAGLMVVNNSQEKIVVSDSEMYSSETDYLTGRWRYNGNKTVTSYRYALLKESENRLPLDSEWVLTEEESVVVDFSESTPLLHGETYKFFVQAFFDDLSFSSVFSNEGVTIDTTGINFISDPYSPDYVVSKGIWINWNVEDLESGIQSIEAIVEKLARDSDGNVLYTEGDFPQPVYERLTEVDLPAIENPDKIFINSDRNGMPLNLKSGDKIYITVRATNGSGFVADRITNAILIDDTAPPIPKVIDSGDIVKPESAVRANWMWSDRDPESGNLSYQWKVFRDEDGIESVNWSNKSTAFELPDMGTYESLGGINNDLVYIAVKTVNGAGLESVGISNGIRLDNQAPTLADVRLSGTTGSDDLRYINRKNDLNLIIEGFDNTEIENYFWSYGKYDDFSQWKELEAETSNTNNSIFLELNDQVVDGDILIFKTAAEDTLGHRSAFGFSKGVMYDTTKPEVINVNGYLSGNTLRYDWESRHVLAPIVSYSYELKKLINVDTGSAEIVASGIVENNYFSIDVSDPEFEDNYYMLEVTAQTAAANYSPNVVSNVVMVDKTAPVVSEFSNNRFTSKKVDFDITAIEPTSRITEFQYAVGTYESPNTISGKWRSVKTGANTINRTFFFDDLPGGNDSVIDGTELMVRVRVKNSAGLWSPVISGLPILVDKTPALINHIEVGKFIMMDDLIYNLTKAYTSDSTGVDKISLSTTDEQSGIKFYEFGIVDAANKEVGYVVWGARIPVLSEGDEILQLFNKDQLAVKGIPLQNEGLYSVAVRVYNGSEDPSEVAYSNDVTVDLTAPAITFSPDDSTSTPGNLHQEIIDDALVRLISNGENVNVAYYLSEDTSEKVFIQFDTELPSMEVEKPISIVEFTPTDLNGYYVFDKTDIDNYGNYRIIARLTDAAGNHVETGASQYIRLNSPPLITLTDNVTTPGKPMTFKLEESAEDPDTLGNCYWIFGNGSETSESDFTTSYTHSELWASETDYDLKLRVADVYGKEAEKIINIKVLNTSEGILYLDEFWSGDHTITGLVEIPESLTLHIADNSNIFAFSSTPEATSEVGLLVNGTLNAGNNINFTVHQDVADYFWRGIHVNGTADIGQSFISRAVRGLTSTGLAEIGLVNTTFRENLIGAHIIDNVIVLADLFFYNNYEYAIKEDGSAVPNVIGCFFSGNTYDYYDGVLTAIDYSKLNTISSNSGNTGN